MTSAPPLVALAGDWAQALERSGFWRLFTASRGEPPRTLVLLSLAGDRSGDPRLVPPAAVEALLDLIHQRTGAVPVLAASADESLLWAGNRQVHALADLLGYRFVTDGGLEYDLVDLGEDLVDAPFPAGTTLHDTRLSAGWLEADIRLNLARIAPHPAEGFTAGLTGLLGCLPRADKVLHYRHRRDGGAVLAELLRHCPPHHTLIDAAPDPAGPAPPIRGGGRTGPAIASGCALLADYAAALKVGLDPHVSPLVASAAGRDPFPCGATIDGSLAPVERPFRARPVGRSATRFRRHSEAGDRLLESWLTRFDPQDFPALRPLDTKAVELAADLRGDGSSPAGNAAVTALELLVGAAGRVAEGWRTLYDKDALRRKIVPLGIDPDAIPRERYDGIVTALDALLPIAASAPEHAPGLRWRRYEQAVLFCYSRALAIPFPLFVDRVDVSRTIGFMNDYLGGVVVVRDRDEAGRPVRQAERNLYLPQPNYLVVYGAEPIDVTKIEVVRYASDEHRLYWKTIASSNGTARVDDGIACFEREGAGTRITIVGKQHFILPQAMRLFDLSLVPDLEATLTTDAYRRFFERTTANFEALVEGRSVALGRDPEEDTPHPSIQLEAWAGALAERAGPWLARMKGEGVDHPPPDPDGFVHVVPRR